MPEKPEEIEELPRPLTIPELVAMIPDLEEERHKNRLKKKAESKTEDQDA